MENESVPKLRFSEFSGKWNLSKVEDLLKESKLGGNYSNSSKQNEYPLIKMGNIGRGEITVEQLDYIDGDEIDKAHRVKHGDLFFNTRNTLELVGKVGIWRSELEKAYYNSNLLRITFANNFFMNYRFNTYEAIKKLRRVATGTTSVAAIYNRDLYGIKLFVPDKPEEQQKIEDFLSSVDQKIKQLRRKKELLEEYKMGVMQKLFSQENRFKDENGEDFPDWEEYNVDKFLKLFVTNSFSRNDLTYDSGKVKNIHYGDIHSEFKMGFKVNEETVPYIVEEKKLSKYDEDQYLKPGDLIIADASEDYVDIGKAIEVLETGDDKILAGLHTIHARDKKPLTVVGFKGYLFRSEAVRKQLKRVSQGASVLGISKGNFREINVKLPCLDEQQKIVEFLQNIDKNITLVESKIEKFQTFKKGLLQQMFV